MKEVNYGDVRWVWLDLDDTLMDFRANSRESLRIIYNQCQLDRYISTIEEWIESYETHNHSLWDRYSRQEITQDFLRVDRFFTPLRPGWNGKENELKEFSRQLDSIYLDILARQTVMIPGAFELLRHLRAHKYNIGVLSNGFNHVQHAKLHNSGLDKMIDLLVLSDDIGINKPDTRLYHHAMRQAGETSSWQHLMIGDNLNTDIRGAIDSGWHAIHFDRDRKNPPEWVDGHLVTPDLESLIPLLMPLKG
ncbi:MAG: YjjG family noncanonical pyrimidine nucleotidase [Duncaniella sp.]|nr:YjjG family noncanonical pyrimidine nucleotidase [Duncaniella sp.]